MNGSWDKFLQLTLTDTSISIIFSGNKKIKQLFIFVLVDEVFLSSSKKRSNKYLIFQTYLQLSSGLVRLEICFIIFFLIFTFHLIRGQSPNQSSRKLLEISYTKSFKISRTSFDSAKNSLQTKQLRVPVPLQSLIFHLSSLFRARSSLTFGKQIHSKCVCNTTKTNTSWWLPKSYF